MIPEAKQLKLTPSDREALRKRIEDDWTSDSSDLEGRNKLYQRAIRLWEAATAPHNFPEQERSNFHIPLTQWNCLAKLAKELDALLGEDSEIAVRGVGPQDAERAQKIQRFINWRFKISLKIFKKLYDYLQQKIVLGTSIAFTPWVKRERVVRDLVPKQVQVFEDGTDPQTGLPIQVPRTITEYVEEERTVVDFEGPDIVVENVEDWVIPYSAKSIDEADHVARRLRLTVDELLDMADKGQLDKEQLRGENLEKLRHFAETGSFLEAGETDSGKVVRDEKKAQQGIPQTGIARDERLTVVNWLGKWRKKSAKPEERAQEIVAFWQPDLNLLLGASRLVDFFPDGRRPFVKSELIRNFKSPWGVGLPQLLESINLEMDTHHNALTDAGVFALGPLIFYEPVAGFNPETFRYEPFQAIPVADASKVNVVNLANINMGPYVALQGQLLAYAERISGLTEAELGRPFSQPNAPRTLGQQQLIQAGSTVRLLLDLRMERESLRELINRIWELDKRFLPEEIFFRVSESGPGEVITKEEMQGNYDFDIGPATSTANKQQDLMMFTQFYALAAQSPVTLQNPALRAELDKKLMKRFGQDDLASFLPDFKAMRPPQPPETENIILTQGGDVDPHPQDNHTEHIAKHSAHRELIANAVKEGILLDPVGRIVGGFDAHIAEHEQMQQATAGGGVLGRPAGGMGMGGNGGGGILPTDQTGVPNDALNMLKGMMNSGGGNLA